MGLRKNDAVIYGIILETRIYELCNRAGEPISEDF